MGKLKYTFKNDTLFKMLFVKHPDLLERLVAALLGIRPESIGKFTVTNSEMPPAAMKEKFCRLDINMIVDGQQVNLEIQVGDKGNYPERPLYYWARMFSSALGESGEYHALPHTIAISIVDFKFLDCAEYHSEFRLFETARRAPLTDKMSLHFFELPKLPENIGTDSELLLWLSLFKAETEKALSQIEALRIPIMTQAIKAYRHITVTDEFKELERLRERARHDEASALGHARREGERKANEKWQGVVAEKDTVIAQKDVAIANSEAQNAELKAYIAELEKQIKNGE